MKIVFKKQDPKAVIAALQEGLGGRKLGKMVEFALGEAGRLDVIIKKMGTSQLTFALREGGDDMEWNLTQEKIALAHRAFRGEVMEKIERLVDQVGGTISK